MSGGREGDVVLNTLPCYAPRNCARIVVSGCGKHERGERKSNSQEVKLEIALAHSPDAASCR